MLWGLLRLFALRSGFRFETPPVLCPEAPRSPLSSPIWTLCALFLVFEPSALPFFQGLLPPRILVPEATPSSSASFPRVRPQHSLDVPRKIVEVRIPFEWSSGACFSCIIARIE